MKTSPSIQFTPQHSLGLPIAALWLCAAAAIAHADPNLSDEVRKAMAYFDHEPTAQATQRAAIMHARMDTQALDNWGQRARWAYVAPEALDGFWQLEHHSDDDFSTREDLDKGFNVEETTTTFDDDQGERWRAGVGARWDLSKIVFNPDELDVATTATRQARLRQLILEQVTQVYFQRRRLQLKRLLVPPMQRLDAVAIELEIEALTAELDALTGGWFSASIKPRRSVPSPSASDQAPPQKASEAPENPGLEGPPAPTAPGRKKILPSP